MLFCVNRCEFMENALAQRPAGTVCRHRHRLWSRASHWAPNRSRTPARKTAVEVATTRARRPRSPALPPPPMRRTLYSGRCGPSLARRLHLGAVGAGLRRGYSFRGGYGGNGNPVRAGSVERAWREHPLRQRGLQAACSYVYRMGLPTSRPRWDHLAVVIPPVGAARAFPPWVSDSKARVQDVDGAVVKNGALLENFRDAQVAVAPAVATDLECHMAGVPDGVIGIFGVAGIVWYVVPYMIPAGPFHCQGAGRSFAKPRRGCRREITWLSGQTTKTGRLKPCGSVCPA